MHKNCLLFLVFNLVLSGWTFAAKQHVTAVDCATGFNSGTGTSDLDGKLNASFNSLRRVLQRDVLVDEDGIPAISVAKESVLDRDMRFSRIHLELPYSGVSLWQFRGAIYLLVNSLIKSNRVATHKDSGHLIKLSPAMFTILFEHRLWDLSNDTKNGEPFLRLVRRKLQHQANVDIDELQRNTFLDDWLAIESFAQYFLSELVFGYAKMDLHNQLGGASRKLQFVMPGIAKEVFAYGVPKDVKYIDEPTFFVSRTWQGADAMLLLKSHGQNLGYLLSPAVFYDSYFFKELFQGHYPSMSNFALLDRVMSIRGSSLKDLRLNTNDSFLTLARKLRVIAALIKKDAAEVSLLIGGLRKHLSRQPTDGDSFVVTTKIQIMINFSLDSLRMWLHDFKSLQDRLGPNRIETIYSADLTERQDFWPKVFSRASVLIAHPEMLRIQSITEPKETVRINTLISNLIELQNQLNRMIQ